MRQIKFRAWDEDKKEITKSFNFFDVEGDGGYGDIYNPKLDFDNSISVYQLHDENLFILMQFTGLCDKNGKEIYEGDILEIKNYEKGFGWTTRKAFVFFEDGCFKIDNNNYWNPLVAHVIGEDTDYKGWTAKVIGNIYENPELIKDGGEKNE